MSKTAEEILNQYRDESNKDILYTKDEALTAMEEYSEERCIGMAEFINENQLYKIESLWYKSENSTFKPLFDFELYNLFIQSTQNK